MECYVYHCGIAEEHLVGLWPRLHGCFSKYTIEHAARPPGFLRNGGDLGNIRPLRALRPGAAALPIVARGNSSEPVISRGMACEQIRVASACAKLSRVDLCRLRPPPCDAGGHVRGRMYVPPACDVS